MKRSIIFLALVTFILSLAACSPQAAPTPTMPMEATMWPSRHQFLVHGHPSSLAQASCHSYVISEVNGYTHSIPFHPISILLSVTCCCYSG